MIGGTLWGDIGNFCRRYNAIFPVWDASGVCNFHEIIITFVSIGKIIKIKMPRVYDKVTKQIKPDWLKIKLHGDPNYSSVSKIVEDNALHTICSSGLCPNKAECWSRRTATFMIMGEICTRSCRFCATQTGKTLPLSEGEPQRVARSVRIMGLKHAVITSVTRDDLPDGGARHWAGTICEVRNQNPETTIEVLVPDFDAREELIDIVLGASPDIFGHNIETVKRLTPQVRSRARYDRSLEVLRYAAGRGAVVKSGLMLGLGENRREIVETLEDLLGTGCRIMTLGQYLQPTRAHWPVAEWVHPDTFGEYKALAMSMGFGYVAAGPLVRSSYLAEEALAALNIKY